jgi:hypothetical protein
VQFDENIYGLTPSDLLVTGNGTNYTDAQISGSGQSYSVQVTGVSGNGTLVLAVKTGGQGSGLHDQAGNRLAASVTSAAIMVDNAGPAATNITVTSSNPSRGGVATFAVNFSESVNGFSDASDLVFVETGTVGHATAAISGGPQQYAVTVSGVHGGGTISLAANTASGIVDLAGNTLAASVTSLPVVIDNAVPTVFVAALVSNSQTPTLTGTAGDNIAVASVDITVNGHTHPAVLDPGSGVWSIVWPDTLPQGVYDVAASATDTVGNTANDATTNELTVDVAPPTGTIVINSGASTTGTRNVTLTLTWNDGIDGSGVTGMRFSDDGTAWTEWEAPRTARAYTLPAGVGYHTVHVQYRDGAGNWSVAYNDYIDYTPVPPVLSSVPRPSPWNVVRATQTRARRPLTPVGET